MTELLPFANVALLAVVAVLLLALLLRRARGGAAALASRLDAFEKGLERTEQSLRDEVARGREESARTGREQRQELGEAFTMLGETVTRRIADAAAFQKGQLDSFAGQLAAFAQASGDRLDGVRAESAAGARQLREEVVSTLKALSANIAQTMGELASLQQAKLEAMSKAMVTLSGTNEQKLEALRAAVDARLQAMQGDSARQLEQMRQTVDEKLQGTLERRLGESFKQVSERLEQVHKGLGEMQILASGVGDLKKVLTNVKTRGTWGEVQLGALLEQVLHQEQYAANVATKDGGERVEFAVRLPGQGAGKEDAVWLPIDAKFPVEDYQRLIEAQERADVEGLESAGRQLENRVKQCAREICGKYLNPPKTTDFGILFLPTEGLFAEVVRRIGLTESIQRESRVVIAGPTTLWSILSSLQMGFRTLAIQKRSGEVWTLLAAVKTEWTKYGEVLDAVQKKLHQASESLEKAQVRSRAVGRKLRGVEELPVGEAAALLPVLAADEEGAAAEAEAEDGAGT